MLPLMQGCDGWRRVVNLLHMAGIHAVCATLRADPGAACVAQHLLIHALHMPAGAARVAQQLSLLRLREVADLAC